MAANPDYAAGEVIANKYVVEGLLGESPSARIFAASGSAGKLCVKVYRPEVSARLLAAPDFFLKAGVMAEVEHDNICGCIDVQEEMGLVFVARAFAEGQSFEDWIRGHRDSGNYFSRGLELLWQTCQGLSAIHERTRHLAIHPGNVLVGPIVAKLSDWDPRALGNMEMTPDALPARSEYLGYRAPEVSARGTFLSYPSTDLYAVAGLLYRLLRGEHPSAEPSGNLGHIRSFDREISLFLGKAMHARPEERFQDAAAFSDALWDLQGAMQRLQERGYVPGPGPASRPEFSGTPTTSAPAVSGFPKPGPPQEAMGFPVAAAAPDGDSFFDFFPTETSAPANPEPPRGPAPSGDTLFGAPAFPTRRDPPHEFPPAVKSGLGGLEMPGTLFGNQPSPIPAPSRFDARGKGPDAPKPLAVSLSSLEIDPLDAAGNATAGGFTAYGFKGAGENHTGIYNSESDAGSTKTKLLIALGAAGALLVLLGLGGLYLYLRDTAAPPETADPAPANASDEDFAAQEAAPPRSFSEPSPGSATVESRTPAHIPAQDPAAQASDANPAPADPPPAVAARTDGYSEPPMPVEPPRPGSAPAGAPSPQAASPSYQGNNLVTPEREAALMAMARTGAWPGTASERLKAADDLNDLGRTAEANMAYAKALSGSGLGDKQRILAYGGMAATFHSMGMADQARDAAQRILDINPRNAFALKLMEKLK